MKYIDSEKLIAEIGRRKKSIDEYPFIEAEFGAEMRREGKIQAYNEILSLITSLQQEQPEGNLEYWLEHFGMPKGNIDNCITQIAQGYGACRYLEGIQHGAEAVNELAKQEQHEGGCSEKPNDLLREQPEVDLEKEEFVGVAESPLKTFPRVNDFECGGSYRH